MPTVRALIAILLVLSTAPSAWAQLTTELFEGRLVVAGEVLVRPQADSDVLIQLAADPDLEPVSRVGRGELLLLRSKSRPTADLVRDWSGRSGVAWAEPNYVLRALDTPNDPSFGLLWGLQNTGQVAGGVAGTPGADIDAVTAWSVTTGSTANVVAVIDTGIDYTHPDLAANMWRAPAAFTVVIGGQSITCAAGTVGFNAINRTCNPADDEGHGTHVAGTIGAVGDNGIGVAGVNWTASLMALKFLGSNGSGTTANAIDTITFAIQAKQRFGAAANIRVVNASWGGGGFSQGLFDAITAAYANGILFVAAAGNDNLNNDLFPSYPANYAVPSVVSVASTTNRDLRSGFSNYGATTVDLGAPGSAILSTLPGGQYGSLSGTSMAAPHVAGAAALILAACNLTTDQLKDNLLTHAEPVAALAGITITGDRLNVNASLQACAAPPTPGFTLSANPTFRSILQGQAATYTLSLAPVAGFSGNVLLQVTGLPAGASAVFEPSTVPGASGSSLLTVTTTGSIALGSYPLTVTGTSGTVVRTATLTLSVVPPSAFTMSVAPASRTIAAGRNTVFQLTLSRDATFTSPVSFEVAGLPAGATGTFSAQATTTSQVFLQIATTASVAGGTYPLTVTATGGAVSRTVSPTLTVTGGGATPGFTLSATPATQTVAPGGTAAFTIGIARTGGFTGEVAFSLAGLPAGASSAFAPPATAGSESTLTLTTTAAIVPGTYPLTITGVGASLTRTASATLVVQAAGGGGFTLSVVPASRTIARGGTTTFSIAINRSGGYTGPVTFTVSGLPGSGATATFLSASPTSSTAALRIVTTAGVAPGTYPLTISGSGGGTTSTGAATLNITP